MRLVRKLLGGFGSLKVRILLTPTRQDSYVCLHSDFGGTMNDKNIDYNPIDSQP